MSEAAILRGWLYVPLPAVGDRSALTELKTRLTYMPKYAEEGDEPIQLFNETDMPGYLGVPRAFGLHRFRHLDVQDETTFGEAMIDVASYRRPNPNHPSVKDPEAQAKFMRDLHSAAQEHETFLATAPTGSGKTVSSLDMALNLGRKTLILVHLERLMKQWIDDSIVPILGVPKHRVGMVQGDICDFEGKDFVVGMLHSINLRTYSPEFYNAFGTIIFDEVHKVGSRFFAPAVGMFPAYYRLGLSATPTRKDGGDRVFVWHLGPVRVVSTAEAMEMDVHVLKHRNDAHNIPGKFTNNHGVVAKSLSLDPVRNALIVKMVKRFYDAGRQALIVGESVRHMQTLMALCEKAGVPKESMGQFTSDIHVREVVKSPAGNRVKWKQRKQKDAALSYVKENSQLIFATYGMMTEGIDIPRLDAGIDATPRGSATKLVGRIRRPRPGKRKPLWVTILDTDCPMAKKYFASRCRDYLATKAEIVTNGKAKKSANA